MRDCVVFDLDGTLFSNDEYKHHLEKDPRDWASFFAGIPDYKVVEPVAHICRLLARHISIVYATGRSTEHIEMTYEALRRANLPLGEIYHRAAGDFREDTIIKLELLDEIKHDGFNPLIIFDDRERVVCSLRSAGYIVAQVAEGKY